jgi:hypothetical protein
MLATSLDDVKQIMHGAEPQALRATLAPGVRGYSIMLALRGLLKRGDDREP